MKQLLFILFFIFVRTASAQTTAFSPDSADLYGKATFNELATLTSTFQLPKNQQFLTDFTAKFGKQFHIPARYAEFNKQHIDELEMQLFDERAAQLNFVQSATDISADMKQWLQQQIKWHYWHLLFAYPILKSNADATMKRVTGLPNVLIEDFPVAELSKQQLLQVPAFRQLLPFYITYINSADKQFIKYADRVQAAVDKVSMAQKKLSGNVLDYTVATLTQQAKGNLTASAAKYLLNQVNDPALSALLKTNLSADLQRKEEAKTPTVADKNKLSGLHPKLLDLQGNAFDFSAFKGKIIYLDFWASWCGPCRAEFVHSKKIYDQLTPDERKQIVFLFVSIDEDKEAWKQAVEQLKLAEIGPNAHSIEAAGKYKVQTIPRYVIIGKEGITIDENATRPSQPETLNHLKSLLK